MSRALVAVAALACLGGCSALVGVDDRYAAPASDDAGTPLHPPSGDETSSDASAPESDAVAPDGAEAGARTLGVFTDPRDISVTETHVAVADTSGGRSKIVLFAKADLAAPTTIYDQPDAPASRVVSMALARGQVWYTTVDGKLRRMRLDGTNPTEVSASPSAVLASSGGAVWLVTPDATSSAPTLRWLSSDVLSLIPEASLALGQPVMFADGTDDELAFATRAAGGRWSLARWRPMATQPLVTLATFDAYPSWVAFDASRILVYGQDEGTILAYDRAAPAATPVPVLVNVSGGGVAIASDGANLVLRSQSTLSTCRIDACATSLRKLPVTATFGHARYLLLDATHAYFFHAKSADGPVSLARVPRL